MRAVHGVLAFEMCLAGFCRAFPALAAPDLSFVVCCVMSVSCFACMLWHVAVYLMA